MYLLKQETINNILLDLFIDCTSDISNSWTYQRSWVTELTHTIERSIVTVRQESRPFLQHFGNITYRFMYTVPPCNSVCFSINEKSTPISMTTILHREWWGPFKHKEYYLDTSTEVSYGVYFIIINTTGPDQRPQH